MASAQNRIEIDDFEGFHFLIFFEDNYIYMKISNNETKSLYEKIIEECDLDDIGNITNLNDLFIFFQKGLYQNDEYKIQIIETDSHNLQLLLEKQINEEQKIQSNLYLPKKFSEDEEQKTKIDETENKHQMEIQRIREEYQTEIQRNREEHQIEIQTIQEDINHFKNQCLVGILKQYQKILSSGSSDNQESLVRIEEKHKREMMSIRHDMEQIVSEMRFLKSCLETVEICIGIGDNGIIAGNWQEYSVRVLFSIQNLHITHVAQNTAHCNVRTLTNNLHLSSIDFANIRRLYQLRSLTYVKRNNDNTNFDFQQINNGILEILDFNNNNTAIMSNLSSIERIPSLKHLTIRSAPNLSNASEYIRLLPNLKNLTFVGCPKIQSEDSGKLRQYCDSKGIVLMIQ
jgi:hypothetical protein